MSFQDNDRNVDSSKNDEYHDDLSLGNIFSSDRWTEYFDELSKTCNIELSGYDADGTRLFVTNENPFCDYTRAIQSESFDCPNSCNKLLQIDKSGIIRCQSGMTCFSVLIERPGEKLFIVGRGGFSTYDDLLGFLRIIRQHNYPELPISMPLKFIEEDSIKALSRYINLSVSRQLRSVEARYRLKEKLLRMTSLFDSQAFGTLSKSPQLMYRYILDTIEFVFGDASAVILAPVGEQASFHTIYSIGKHKDALAELKLDTNNPAMQKMRDAGGAVFFENTDEVLPEGQFSEIKSSYFLPLIIRGNIEAVVAVFNRDFMIEDMKILNAFREYVQLNLENRDLRQAVLKNDKADRELTCLTDVTRSISSILDKKILLNTLLEKSLQLTNAEQGSLMLMDADTSELVVEARRSVDDMVQEKMRFKAGEGISGMVLEKGAPILVEDIEKDPRVRQANRSRYRTKSFVSVPIRIEDRLAGVLNLSDKIKGGVFNKKDLDLIESFVSNMVIAIDRSILFGQAEKLQKLSITDPLTGIYNRRYLNRRLSEEITRYNRYRHPFSFMMLDLDKFKEYNDTFGHIAGDNLIKNLADTMEKSLRTIDIAARFGGDELVAIFPQTPKMDAIQICNRIKEEIVSSLSEHNIEMPITISVGLATFPDDASSIMELIEKTDQALYLAKKGGGNRVVYL